MRADRGRPGEPARPPDPDRHPGDGIRPQLATAGITPQDTRLTAPPAGRPPRAALQPRPWLERIEPYRPGLHADSDDGSLASNESPLGASARVVTAITGDALQAHRYLTRSSARCAPNWPRCTASTPTRSWSATDLMS